MRFTAQPSTATPRSTTPTDAARPAFERIAVAGAVAGIADLLSKRAVLGTLQPGAHVPLFGGLIDLVFVRNPRGALEVLGAPPLVMGVLALATLAALWAWLRRLLRRSALAQVGYGAIVGGAVGNVVDRLTHGYVVDFIEPRGFYAFNGADVAIALGLTCIAVATMRARA